MTKQYYTLRFERHDAFHKAGEQVANADNTLRIGQTESCDIRLANDSQYEDAVIAIIEKRNDGKGWKLIKVSPFKEHEVLVNGTPVDHVHFLKNGDRIAFTGQRQELVFNIREDAQYTASGIVTMPHHHNRPVTIWLILVSLAIIGFLLHQLYSRPMSEGMIEDAEQSVFQIRVDSVQLIVSHGDSVSILESAPFYNEFGTAFLTTSGHLVTARHCIEPWLNLPEGTPMDTLNPATPKHVRMALKAITNNIMAENTGDSARWQMVSYCTLRKPEVNDSIWLSTTSTAFRYNDSRDHIMAFGDYEHQYFWRSLKVRPHRTDMMLGDIAYLPDAEKLLHQKGNIRMATKEEVLSLCNKPNRSLIIMGRTHVSAEDSPIQSPEAHLMLQLTEAHCKDGYPNTVIAHDGNISHGFSGGPVMTRQGLFGYCVIGVVSVTDENNDKWYYSVPVSEIERMNND